MPSNKDRLYVALFARGGAPKMPGLEDTYVSTCHFVAIRSCGSVLTIDIIGL